MNEKDSRYGYDWSVTFTQDVRNLGADSRYTSVDVSGLNSVCLCANISSIRQRNTGNLAVELCSDLMYSSPACGSTVYGKESPYQVLK